MTVSGLKQVFSFTNVTLKNIICYFLAASHNTLTLWCRIWHLSLFQTKPLQWYFHTAVWIAIFIASNYSVRVCTSTWFLSNCSKNGGCASVSGHGCMRAHAASQLRVLCWKWRERLLPHTCIHKINCELLCTLHISFHFDIVCTPPGSTTGRERTAPRRRRSNVAKEWEEEAAAQSEQTIRQRWRGTTGNGDVPLRWAHGTRCFMWDTGAKGS